MKRILPVVLALLCHATAKAQTGKYFNNDQLSSSFVTQVYVDREGFLWITTRDTPRTFDVPNGAPSRVDLSWDYT